MHILGKMMLVKENKEEKCKNNGICDFRLCTAERVSRDLEKAALERSVTASCKMGESDSRDPIHSIDAVKFAAVAVQLANRKVSCIRQSIAVGENRDNKQKLLGC